MSIKATRRTMISSYAQITNDYVLGYKIPELVKHEKKNQGTETVV